MARHDDRLLVILDLDQLLGLPGDEPAIAGIEPRSPPPLSARNRRRWPAPAVEKSSAKDKEPFGGFDAARQADTRALLATWSALNAEKVTTSSGRCRCSSAGLFAG
ncbi:MAG: hypothetical protein U0800_27810 [Isosphaeraceae bacterium]